MRSRHVVALGTLVAISLFWGTGCEGEKFTATVFNPLNLKLPFLPYQQPVRVGIVDYRGGLFDPATWNIQEIGAPSSGLRRQMERRLNLPVQFEVLKPFQIAAHLESGRLDFALMDARDYLATGKEFGSFGSVIAVSEVETRRGLIVANAKSKVNSLEQIRGKRFAFGPQGDLVLDSAAKQALIQAGVALDDIKREVLPVPNAFQHHISSREAAFEVVWGIGTDVGVIEYADYEAFPDTGGSLLLRTFGKDNFRVLGETEALKIQTIPAGPLLASGRVDPDLQASVLAFFLAAERDCPEALSAMGLAGFHTPEADVAAEMGRLASAQEKP